MNKLFLIAFIAVMASARAQSDTVQYQMLNDDPNYSYWGAGLSYGFSIDRFNFPLVGFGLDGIFLNEKFAVNFHSTYNLFERLTDYSMNGHPIHESIYEAEKSREFGIMATYFFLNDVSKIDQSVKLKQSGNTTYVMLIPAKRSLRFGADIGYFAGVSYYNFGDATLNGIDQNGNATTLESRTENAAVSSMFNQQLLRIGANMTKTSKFEVDTDKYGKKRTQDFTRIYLHALIGFGQKLDDIFYFTPDILGNEIYTQYDITTNGIFLPVGAAIGYEYYTMNKIGVSWIAELGLMPGPNYSIVNNMYLDLKIRFHYGKFL
jgi:hypothetical protein